MTLTYQLAEGPEVICAQMLQGCAKQALEKLEKNATEACPSKWVEASLPRDGVDSQPLLFSLKGQEPQPTASHFVQVDVGPFSMSKEGVWNLNGTWLFSSPLL